MVNLSSLLVSELDVLEKYVLENGIGMLSSDDWLENMKKKLSAVQ